MGDKRAGEHQRQVARERSNKYIAGGEQKTNKAAGSLRGQGQTEAGGRRTETTRTVVPNEGRGPTQDT